MIDKDFEQQIVAEGIVDTSEYRYMYRSRPDEPCIVRIAQKYLDTDAENDKWETIIDCDELRMARLVDLYAITQHEYAAAIHSYVDWIEDVAIVDDDDTEEATTVYEHIGRLTPAEFVEAYSVESLDFIAENNDGEPLPENEMLDCWEWNGKDEFLLYVFPQSWC